MKLSVCLGYPNSLSLNIIPKFCSNFIFQFLYVLCRRYRTRNAEVSLGECGNAEQMYFKLCHYFYYYHYVYIYTHIYICSVDVDGVELLRLFTDKVHYINLIMISKNLISHKPSSGQELVDGK